MVSRSGMIFWHHRLGTTHFFARPSCSSYQGFELNPTTAAAELDLVDVLEWDTRPGSGGGIWVCSCFAVSFLSVGM